MDTIQTILARRSVRRYRPEPLPAQHLRQILEAGRQAPSASNRQPWTFVVVREAEQKRRLAAACRGQMWLADAACIVVGVALPEVSPRWCRVDVAIAMENMVLAARSLGYGACWIGAFEPDEVKAVCGIPVEAEVVACTPLGAPEAWPEPRERKAPGEVFFSERYGQAIAFEEGSG
ncbi:MAG TPA: nitroreductase family protein [Anaerolineae bacterium]|nr:nitroreductase family protein [Anaerolineae bacterium]HOQ97915.1 nitroreductase family protein [Anaerolineae bacterium]HPL27635.1 nitroreductase family protein [Anaerolineae bacterium]